ncbi:LOW QUALITY PROTEIN: GTPase-activator protein for Ras-like GTPase containing protein [Colletotrichum tofieldiae]|nr:LOW QUALITY PROTEIN: GTPase-activator protein for Ras-like GTPase containing protein [Colletotrichum tofieldiae]GKT79477.1 LOW QUALITY PROTEIN: GTPase-activator protein for Ras-like GTPase containing protein [Colletotrichum tofieldiae]
MAANRLSISALTEASIAIRRWIAPISRPFWSSLILLPASRFEHDEGAPVHLNVDPGLLAQEGEGGRANNARTGSDGRPPPPPPPHIRRYFWAYNTLGVVNEGLRAMLAAYRDTFPDDFWEGKHQTLWPHPLPDSPEGKAYRDKMAPLRSDLERACRDLETVHAKNAATRKEIENLRDQLFSGSSIKESRRAIEQGDNIKVLTLGSMVFLPLTFVTSVFGMTEFTIPAQDWRFPVTMVCVCVPFILALILLQTRAGYSLAKHTFAAGSGETSGGEGIGPGFVVELETLAKQCQHEGREGK